MKAVLLAGGVGSRLGKLTNDKPKPMVKVGDKPVLEHQIRLLRRYGVSDVVICLGYLPQVIKEYFGNGIGYGVSIEYTQEESPLGSGGCLSLVEELVEEEFLVLNGDVMVEMSIQRLIDFHRKKRSSATLCVHPNDHPYDSDLVELSEDGRVVGFHDRNRPKGDYHNLVNAGAYLLSDRVFEYLKAGEKKDLASELLKEMVSEGEKIFGYKTPEYLKDMGTVERLDEVVKDHLSGKIKDSNLEKKRPAVFLDRDGTINVEKNHLSKIEDMKLIDGAAYAIKMLNKSIYLAIVVTNQPVVARGQASIEDVDRIHGRMETLLGNQKAKVDDILFCPHHPDRGYPGENPEYKIACECRKPATGMIDKAVSEYNIDLEKSYIVGDSTRDVMTGKNAGIKTIGLRTGHGLKDDTFEVEADEVCEDLKAAVTSILGRLRHV